MRPPARAARKPLAARFSLGLAISTDRAWNVRLFFEASGLVTFILGHLTIHPICYLGDAK